MFDTGFIFSEFKTVAAAAALKPLWPMVKWLSEELDTS